MDQSPPIKLLPYAILTLLPVRPARYQIFWIKQTNGTVSWHMSNLPITYSSDSSKPVTPVAPAASQMIGSSVLDEEFSLMFRANWLDVIEMVNMLKRDLCEVDENFKQEDTKDAEDADGYDEPMFKYDTDNPETTDPVVPKITTSKTVTKLLWFAKTAQNKIVDHINRLLISTRLDATAEPSKIETLQTEFATCIGQFESSLWRLRTVVDPSGSTTVTSQHANSAYPYTHLPDSFVSLVGAKLEQADGKPVGDALKQVYAQLDSFLTVWIKLLIQLGKIIPEREAAN